VCEPLTYTNLLYSDDGEIGASNVNLIANEVNQCPATQVGNEQPVTKPSSEFCDPAASWRHMLLTARECLGRVAHGRDSEMGYPQSLGTSQ
jgi:hypothetical protein